MRCFAPLSCPFAPATFSHLLRSRTFHLLSFAPNTIGKPHLLHDGVILLSHYK